MNPPSDSAKPLRFDWGEALAVSTFYGREQELTLLTQWVGDTGALSPGERIMMCLLWMVAPFQPARQQWNQRLCTSYGVQTCAR